MRPSRVISFCQQHYFYGHVLDRVVVTANASRFTSTAFGSPNEAPDGFLPQDSSQALACARYTEPAPGGAVG